MKIDSLTLHTFDKHLLRDYVSNLQKLITLYLRYIKESWFVLKILLKGAVIGGVIVHLWYTVSYMVLPWHQWTYLHFESEERVKNVLEENALESGIYILPNYRPDKALSKAKNKREQAKVMKAMQDGPFVFASFKRDGTRSMGRSTLFSVLSYVLAAGVMTWLVMRSKLTSFIGKVSFVKAVAFFAFVVGILPNWIWWEFSLSFILVGFLDVMIAWSLAAFALAKITEG